MTHTELRERLLDIIENSPQDAAWTVSGKHLMKLVEQALKEEREICARLCEQYSDTDSGPDGITIDYHAHLIRARGVL